MLALLASLPATRAAAAWPEDALITTRVKIALFTAKDVSPRKVHVDTQRGRVRLHGSVPTAGEVARAEAAARGVPGVKDVHNLLQVVPEPVARERRESDAIIKSHLEAALAKDPALAGSKIEVRSVNNGAVLLEGKAKTLDAYLRALEIVANTEGVRRLASEVRSPDVTGKVLEKME
jgi:osmotically-inducible protein OsmY